MCNVRRVKPRSVKSYLFHTIHTLLVCSRTTKMDLKDFVLGILLYQNFLYLLQKSTFPWVDGEILGYRGRVVDVEIYWTLTVRTPNQVWRGGCRQYGRKWRKSCWNLLLLKRKDESGSGHGDRRYEEEVREDLEVLRRNWLRRERRTMYKVREVRTLFMTLTLWGGEWV